MRGVELIDLERHVDDRGDLVELWRHSWFVFKLPETEGDTRLKDFSNMARQVYTVRSRYPGIIRALHRHEALAELFVVLHGAAKFVLVDARPSPGRDSIQIVILDDRRPQALYVPAGIFHGWMALEPDTKMIAIMNGEYNTESPDEERIDPHEFDAVLGYDPWEVKGR